MGPQGYSSYEDTPCSVVVPLVGVGALADYVPLKGDAPPADEPLGSQPPAEQPHGSQTFNCVDPSTGAVGLGGFGGGNGGDGGSAPNDGGGGGVASMFRNPT